MVGLPQLPLHLPNVIPALHCSVDIHSIRAPEELLGALHSSDINYEKRLKNAEKRVKQGHKIVAVKAGTPRAFSQKIYSSPCEESFRDGPKINGIS